MANVLKNALTVQLARRWRSVVIGPDWNAFHRDPIYKQLMLEVLDSLPITSFVETGTWMGDSTQSIAIRHPSLPIYTSEVVEQTFNRAKTTLRRYENVHPLLGSSDETVGKLIAENKVGALPFFYLDAHWQTYWPLRNELKHISNACLKAVIVIDDFEVPNRPEFGFDIDGGADITEGAKCNLDYIRASLGTQNSYRLLFPKYDPRQAHKDLKHRVDLRGHICLFQNLDEEFARFLSRPFVSTNYRQASLTDG